MRDLVIRLRKAFEPKVDAVRVKGISPGSQPFVLWRNRQLAAHADALSGETPHRAMLEVFCRVFPDAFVVVGSRPRTSTPRAAGRAGR